MKIMSTRAAAALLLLGGFVAAATAQSAKAHLIGTRGDTVGTATFSQTDTGVAIVVDIKRMAPGMHALHIHETATCTSPDFKSAGGHFNPTGKKHGFLDPQGPHAGDLPNFTVAPDSSARFTVTTRLVTLQEGRKTSLTGGKGTSLVVHQHPDDYLSDPAGASGSRIACGAIVKSKQ